MAGDRAAQRLGAREQALTTFGAVGILRVRRCRRCQEHHARQGQRDDAARRGTVLASRPTRLPTK
jgi:hypothetical protein